MPPNRKKPKLTDREKQAVDTALGFVLCGDDPWEGDGTYEVVDSAQEKLRLLWAPADQPPEPPSLLHVAQLSLRNVESILHAMPLKGGDPTERAAHERWATILREAIEAHHDATTPR